MNVVLIVCHDIGIHLGCYGQPSPTPNLDQIADEGILFENNFATAPLCSPSRGSIITGKYPHVNGLLGLTNNGWNLPEENQNLAKVFGANGYDTYLFGLQHETEIPEELGFHQRFVDNGYKSSLVTDDFLAFLDNRESDKPFYARIGYFDVHYPWSEHPEIDPQSVQLPDNLPLKDTEGYREVLANFNGDVKAMDNNIGRTFEAIKKSRFADDTLVVFTTDHGVDFPGQKSTLFDGGIHTALLMWKPGTIDAGKRSDILLSNVDLYPTILEMTNLQIPNDIQGRSFLSYLSGKQYEEREWVFAEKNTSAHDYKRGIRTKKFKYIRNYNEGAKWELTSSGESSPIRRDMGDDHLVPRVPENLFDLENDPLEQNDHANDADFLAIKEQMSNQLDSILEETNDPILDWPITRPPPAERLAKIKENARKKLFPGLKVSWDMSSDKLIYKSE